MAKRRKTPDKRFREGDKVCLVTEGELLFELISNDCSHCGTHERGRWTIDGLFYLGDEDLESLESA